MHLPNYWLIFSFAPLLKHTPFDLIECSTVNHLHHPADQLKFNYTIQEKKLTL